MDTHIHAPQYVYTGTAMNLQLLEWLNKYTFPTEAKFANLEFAADAYRKVVVGKPAVLYEYCVTILHNCVH